MLFRSTCTGSSYADRTDPNKTINYFGCDGQAQNCTSSSIEDNTIANKRIHYSGCDGNAQNCTSSRYDADGGYYSCDENVQNCTFEAYAVCLLKGTLITMADGTQKPIENLENGEFVMSVNPETWELEPTMILACDSHMFKFANESDKWYFEDGTIIETAHRHRFYNLEHNTVKYMDEWQIGEHACKLDGTNPKLVKHEKIEGDCQHYTLFTKNQTYFANNLMSGNRHTLKFGEQKAIQFKQYATV